MSSENRHYDMESYTHKDTKGTNGMDNKERANKLSKEIIGAAIEVHSALGPGLLESAYLISLCRELNLRKVNFSEGSSLAYRVQGNKAGCWISTRFSC